MQDDNISEANIEHEPMKVFAEGGIPLQKEGGLVPARIDAPRQEETGVKVQQVNAGLTYLLTYFILRCIF